MSQLERRKHVLLAKFAALVFLSFTLAHCSGGASSAPPPPPPPVAAGLGGSNYAWYQLDPTCTRGALTSAQTCQDVDVALRRCLFSNYQAQNF